MNEFGFEQIIAVLSKPEVVINWSEEDWQKAIWVLRHSRMLASVKYLLEDKGLLHRLPEVVQFHLFSAVVIAERQAKQVFFEVEELKRNFANQPKIKPVLLKGAAYIVNGTRNSRGRICSDIDLLVEKDVLNIAESMLVNSLWRHQDISDYDEKYYREYAHEIPPLIHLERATVLDLHHNIYMPISNRAPNIDVFLQRIQKSPLGLYTLSPAAGYIHSVIHLYLNEDVSFGLRDVYDQWQLCNEFGDQLFWHDCVEISKDCGFLFELSLSLGLLQTYFKVEIPEFIKQSLAPEFKTIRFKFWLRIYKKAFVPEHFLLDNRMARLARIAIMLRGHWAKMPLSTLIRHTAVKLYSSMYKVLIGEKKKS